MMLPLGLPVPFFSTTTFAPARPSTIKLTGINKIVMYNPAMLSLQIMLKCGSVSMSMLVQRQDHDWMVSVVTEALMA